MPTSSSAPSISQDVPSIGPVRQPASPVVSMSEPELPSPGPPGSAILAATPSLCIAIPQYLNHSSRPHITIQVPSQAPSQAVPQDIRPENQPRPDVPLHPGLAAVQPQPTILLQQPTQPVMIVPPSILPTANCQLYPPDTRVASKDLCRRAASSNAPVSIEVKVAFSNKDKALLGGPSTPIWINQTRGIVVDLLHILQRVSIDTHSLCLLDVPLSFTQTRVGFVSPPKVLVPPLVSRPQLPTQSFGSSTYYSEETVSFSVAELFTNTACHNSAASILMQPTFTYAAASYNSNGSANSLPGACCSSASDSLYRVSRCSRH
ncbi:uncharacterized protein FOMMEDRAFT_150194 [Fomitiporia mediterranea MF3/22]|uniref:uncharacterized protein n=1 Tax=Fomitiporia mediterranea (strain MF3/22) TaxID=694068 RepID=UPI0004409598|nr:uncharacterized protein FOMMEDRAFT_150194 [Fomitiporia mediterranea MF3/22]EJD07654.1 hypothetical protein FOMMEDRAFT_150194 [Fomitiporia mediterranea MF3/22]